MSAGVVFSGDGSESTRGTRVSRGHQCANTLIAWPQARCDSFQHPLAAEAETVEMRELGVGLVGDNSNRQPASLNWWWVFAEETSSTISQIHGRSNVSRPVAFKYATSPLIWAGVMFVLSAAIASFAKAALGNSRTSRARSQWPCTDECQS
jgi:hypothetical protein